MTITASDIIEKIGVAELSEAIGKPQSHVRTMKVRNSIPVQYWKETVTAAKKAGLKINHETLANAHAQEMSA